MIYKLKTRASTKIHTCTFSGTPVPTLRKFYRNGLVGENTAYRAAKVDIQTCDTVCKNYIEIILGHSYAFIPFLFGYLRLVI